MAHFSFSKSRFVYEASRFVSQRSDQIYMILGGDYRGRKAKYARKSVYGDLLFYPKALREDRFLQKPVRIPLRHLAFENNTEFGDLM